MKDKIEQAEANLDRKLEWISRHDTRIAFTAGISIAMLGILASASAVIINWNWYLYVIFGAAALLLSINLILIYLSQYPKTESRNASLVFFGTIASMKVDEFQKRFKQMTNEEYLDDLLFQIHINADILTKKFARLKSALLLLALSVLPWLAAIYISKLYIK